VVALAADIHTRGGVEAGDAKAAVFREDMGECHDDGG
jgi:hypothetical protein